MLLSCHPVRNDDHSKNLLCRMYVYMYVFSWIVLSVRRTLHMRKEPMRKNVSLQHGTKLLQHRRLSYSRHAVNDRDLSTQVNYKMHMNIRRMMGEHKHRHKRSKKLLKVRTFSRFDARNSSSCSDYQSLFLGRSAITKVSFVFFFFCSSDRTAGR